MENPPGFVPSKASLLKTNPGADFQTVVFESYKSKKSRRQPINTDGKPAAEEENVFNIRQAKQEVVKFGMSGFDPQKKEEAKINLLIKLGAKPPKNKSKNYKLLQAERKIEKEKQATRLSFQQLGKNQLGKSNAKGKSFDRKRRKEKGDILSIYGRVQAVTKSTKS
ncbi:hypothetical protein JTB14_003777 [Gonioctena quinquepunctata]|nr:hypothetical protein JTB14_003777 [Gonioctena quinquepunctata]